jgi:hypothetical protein
MNSAANTNTTTANSNTAPTLSTGNRLLSLAMATVLSVAMLAGVDGLARSDSPAPLMAQASSARA